MKSTKKGISLIVLVITIIVMIILATAIILSLNSSNIVEKAKEAKTASDLANAKNVVILAKGEWELMTSAERASKGKTFNVYAESKLQEAGYAVTGKNAYAVTEDGSLVSSGNNELYIDSTGKFAIIPEGFTVSTKAGEETISGGLVIIDNNGNEFVWVPVDDFTKFERTTTYNGTITAPSSSFTEPASTACSNYDSDAWKCLDTLTLSISNDLTGEWAEYNAMRASVEENKGFYIARYEAGTTTEREYGKANGTTDVLVQKGKPVYNWVCWGQSMTDVEGDVTDFDFGYNQGKGAVELSRNMYKGSSSVVSTLCYGVQWDSALQFIYNTDNTYPTNSENKGNYTGSLKNTGSSDAYAVNNIYDMAGNVEEWTMEAVDSDSRVLRGGDYGFDGGIYPTSRRSSNFPDVSAYDNYGFRPTLYIK